MSPEQPLPTTFREAIDQFDQSHHWEIVQSPEGTTVFEDDLGRIQIFVHGGNLDAPINPGNAEILLNRRQVQQNNQP